jgi:glycolate oxidase
MQVLEKDPIINSVFDWSAIGKQMSAIVGTRHVVQKREELITYECDGLTSYHDLQRPQLVVLPQNTIEVAAIVKLCDQQQIPWIARGAGTGLSGGAVPDKNCILIGTARMNKILNIDLANQRVTVQPGVINNWVTQAVSGAGFYYAPDPSSQVICSVGGNVAENSGGVHCLKYGVTVNHVLGLELVLPDGSIVHTGGEIGETPGYDLTGLFVGSEGTLGIATEITLKILKTPESICVLLADFDSIEAAGNAVSDIIGAGIIPGGIEMMDNFSINAVEDVVATGCYPRDAAAILLVEVDGLTVEVEANKLRVEEICRQNGARNVTSASAAMGKISPNYYVQDGVIPRTQLPYVLKEIGRLGEEFGYYVANVFHAGDGNLHPLILYNQADEGALEQVEKLGGEILKLCVSVGGSISGEHGIGTDKRCYMPEMFSEQDLESMQWVRMVFNPKELANPGKIFPTPRTCGEASRGNKEFQGIDRL